MEKRPKEKRLDGWQNVADTSAQPPSAAEGSPLPSPPQERVKGDLAAAEMVRKSPSAAQEGSAAAATKPKARKKTGESAKPQESEPGREVRPIKPGLRKRVRLAEALRLEGLDERAVAETYVVVVEKLRNGTKDENGTQKALVDVLKECSRILEPPRAPGAVSGDVPAIVNLYHNVPRPVRDGQREHRNERSDEDRSQE